MIKKVNLKIFIPQNFTLMKSGAREVLTMERHYDPEGQPMTHHDPLPHHDPRRDSTLNRRSMRESSTGILILDTPQNSTISETNSLLTDEIKQNEIQLTKEGFVVQV